VGRAGGRPQNILTSLFIKPEEMEQVNIHLQAKYKTVEENEVRFQTIDIDDADIVLVGYGLSARIARKTMELARAEGIKVGVVRPITLWPYPKAPIAKAAETARAFLVVELNAGQMVEDVRLAVNGRRPVEHYGRLGGIIPSPEEILEIVKRIHSTL
jgi:2-oxoglutarate ferredoxin oxidoreductase subunit alpha